MAGTAPHQQAPDLPTLRPGATAIVIAVAALALKLPQALAGFLPAGTVLPDWMPDLLGAVSAVWFCIVSAISGVRLLQTGYPLWGGWQLFTAAVAAAATVVAVLQGACKGSRW